MSKSSSNIRELRFNGTWYESNPATLKKQLTDLLLKVTPNPDTYNTKAIIVPHAGYKYSAETAAHSYAKIDPSKVKLIILFGPLHYVSSRGCCLPSCQRYNTPFGPIDVDLEVANKLSQSGMFELISKVEDEKEHNLEMQLPFIAHIMQGYIFKILPVYVGSLQYYDQDQFSRKFIPYFKDASTLFIISSDFCHYGRNFSYTPFEQDLNISKSIEILDKAAISALKNVNRTEFARHLETTRNTICGRYPLLLFLTIIQYLLNHKYLKPNELEAELCDYSRSNSNIKPGESSVSYVSMYFKINPSFQMIDEEL